MIQANELRLGNYINSKPYGIFKIIAISIYPDGANNLFKDLNYYPQSVKLENAIPIPLTEEILLKCGFKFKDKGFPDLSVSYGLATEQIHFVIGNYYQKITYLHELQNLYFALTGEELEINL